MCEETTSAREIQSKSHLADLLQVSSAFSALSIDFFDMPKGKVLSVTEREVIRHLDGAGVNKTDIAKRTKRSRKVVVTFLNNPEGYNKRKYNGAPRKVSDADVRALIRAAKLQKVGSRRLVRSENIKISDRHARRLLAGSSHMAYRKGKRAPVLTKVHKSSRVAFSKARVNKNELNDITIYSDEKRFNLDGPDGLNHYWHDLRGEQEVAMSRQNGGGGVMVWGGISRKGKTTLAILEGKQNAAKYCKTLETHLIPSATRLYGTAYEYQQDNASIHTAKATKAFFEDKKITVIDWPAKSPDLNPIENLWGDMVRVVYAGGKQYDNVDALKTAILKAWDDIEQSRIDALLDSMNNRYFEVISRGGNKSSY